MRLSKNRIDGSLRKREKRDKAPWVLAGLGVVTTVLVLAARTCGGGPETICGDGPSPIPELHVLDSNGERNPNYCKLDSHDGDRICDNNPNEMRNALGELMDMSELPKTWANGDPVKLPLEDETSVDCRINRCGKDKDTLKGPLLDFWYTSHCTQEELQEMLKNPQETASSIKSHCLIPRRYKETCRSKRNPNIPDCGPETDGPCHCENHERCEERPPKHCGNEKYEPDKGEQCDWREEVFIANRGDKSRCAKHGPDKKCNKRCKCVPKVVVVPPTPPTPQIDKLPKCPPEVMSSRGFKALLGRTGNAVRRRAGDIREALGSNAGEFIKNIFAVDVDIHGRVSNARTVGAECGGEPCKKKADLVKKSGLRVKGVKIGAPPEDCSLEYEVPLPPG